MSISSFWPPPGGQDSEQRHSNSQAEGQDSLRQAILYNYNNARVEKQVKETGPVLMRWMKLEPIIQSEVSQKEKHKYSILTHIYGI